MTDAVQPAPHLRFRGSAKFVSESLSTSLFEGATSRHLKANETVVIASSRACSRSL
jgi:hypothetical protein